MRNFPKSQAAACAVLIEILLCAWPAIAYGRTRSPVQAQAQAQALQLPAVVAAAFSRAGIPSNAVGSYVHEVGSVAPVVAVNTATPFNPASTMKLVTTDAALELLGPTFTWKTQAYAYGPQDGGVLQGDLIIRGSGDPKLVIENFWLFLRQIRARGIRDIRGDLLLARGAFAATPYNAAQFDGEPLKPYNAGPDALLLNYKSFGLRFVPDQLHDKVDVIVDPPLAGYKVAAPVLTDGECDDWQGRLRADIRGDGASFDGTFPLSCGEKSWQLSPYAMTDTQYFGAVFRQMWRDLGGSLSGEVRDGVAPPTASLIAEWQSPTLPEVIRDINKYSNNVMARQLLLTLASEQSPLSAPSGQSGFPAPGGQSTFPATGERAPSPAAGEQMRLPATSERAAQLIRSWLASKHIDAPDLVIENGSGLSRSERISAGTMGRMLVAAFRAPTMPEFMSSLPLVGYDGTMRKRLKDQRVAGNAHIKTGTLREVRALAGYVLAASGRRYVVVNLINHANASRGQEAQDLLLEWIYEHG